MNICRDQGKTENSELFCRDQGKTENSELFCRLHEEFEDTKGIIRISISKKNRQHNGQKIPKDNQNQYIEEGQTT